MTERYEVKQQKQPVHWSVQVPGSKSITNRALLMAALTDGRVDLSGVLFSDDSRHFLDSLIQLGFPVEIREQERTVTVFGQGGRIPKPEAAIDVGSAGTAARFLTAMLGASCGTYEIRASEQMARRPMEELFDVLIRMGAEVEWLGQTGHLPVRIHGAGTRILESDTVTQIALDISKSTQFLSAFLLIAPMFPNGLDIRITSEKTDGSYIRITRRMLEEFGLETEYDGNTYRIAPDPVFRCSTYRIEPDVSAACYFYAAAAVTGGYAKVKGVFPDGMQGDLKFLQVLERMGCRITEEPDGISVTGPQRGSLRGVTVSMNDFSDQALTLAAIAPFASSPVWISGIAHIRGQECDRIHAIASNLCRAGIRCEEYPDAVTIYPGQPQGCSIATFEDHRVAMAFSVMGLAADGIVIENPMCCRKTFESYFSLLEELCG